MEENPKFKDFNFILNINNENIELGNCFHNPLCEKKPFDYDYVIFGHYHKYINVIAKTVRLLSPGLLVRNTYMRSFDPFSTAMIIDLEKESTDTDAVKTIFIKNNKTIIDFTKYLSEEEIDDLNSLSVNK